MKRKEREKKWKEERKDEHRTSIEKAASEKTKGGERNQVACPSREQWLLVILDGKRRGGIGRRTGNGKKSRGRRQ